jgi:beta-ribofuranosylaminobenzene 5'-phosphate synthase
MIPVVRVITGSRLHFGLISVPTEPEASRAFGGVGLMVESPSVVVVAKPAAEWSAQGPRSDRALAFARHLGGGPFHIEVMECPPEHLGLGTGTQLGLAVAAAMFSATGQSYDLPDLARRLGRGQRSALGIHGFLQGGFLVEAGKGLGTSVAPLVARAHFPDHWRILLMLPQSLQGWHGQRERDAFTRLARDASSPATMDILCRLTLMSMLPAVHEADLATFSDALHEFNRRVGERFCSVQGGIYSHPTTAEHIAYLRAQGVHGVGQSSWGPCVFAVIEEDRAASLTSAVRRQFGINENEVVISRARNQPAMVEGCTDSTT